jgi:hypothetical protein
MAEWPGRISKGIADSRSSAGRIGESHANIAAPVTGLNIVTRPTSSESEGRILPFRPRGSLFARNVPPPPVPDLEKFERAPDEPDDFRHRMAMNALGLMATVVLIVTGIWIADVMAHMRKDQDCVLIGRSGCTRVDVPPQTR